jgi:hypothetical protein
MKRKKKGVQDARTRIILHLPVNDPAEASAVFSVVGYLRQKRTASPKKKQIKGYTNARIRPPVFEGSWWNKRRWVSDKLTMIIIDHTLPYDDEDFEAEITEMKNAIAQFYDDEGSHQDEIWIVVHTVYHYDY